MTEENSTVTPSEYRNLVKEIAELAMKGAEIEQYESIDEGIFDILQSHLYVLDTNRAAQLIALSDKTPEGYQKNLHLDDDWKQHLSMMARVCLVKDIRDKVQEMQ